MKESLLSAGLNDIPFYKKGKVRDIYKIADNLLIVATDRISAFDVIMPNGIPDKGKILTKLSCFWFDFTKDIIKNHLISADFDKIASFDKRLNKYKDRLDGRVMLVRKTSPLPVECVVRGYLSGSGWKEYKQSGSVSGISIPKDLKESEKLPCPVFTPATKAESGHDENITAKEAGAILGEDIFNFVSKKSIEIYKKASAYALTKGIIIADTKFEFGRIDDKIILIDEILTPDSSRFWPKNEYNPGGPCPSFDKQFVRDYLEQLNWDKAPPAPVLPDDVVKMTQEKYYQALKLLAGV